MFSGLFVLYLWAKPNLSDGHVTLTFNLGAHGACQMWVIVLHLCTKFEVCRLPVRNIFHTFISTLIRMVTLTFQLLTLKLVCFTVHCPDLHTVLLLI